ncbi:unnamed protein product [Microthlaspi erraticum]|uniref:BHLH domain-containing protein n=1 Tax=Microthlaspi erraticum TaxID=1685480 RepID=A0A6D2J4L8_9BRAS|nr:unnamed protein product [Microthlaspi erraticum]
MMFQQEYPLSYKFFDCFENAIVSGPGGLTSQLNPLSSSSSYSATPFCCTTADKQSHSTEKLARDGFGEEPPRKRRRRRTRSDKKIEERENQRMNHIAVERNRRKQMNHFLSTLKSMIPLSYSQRSDQASIVEGTINYLKKQEQLLQSLEAQLKSTDHNQSPNIFSDFFIFPQYSTITATSSSSENHCQHERLAQGAAVADVEVTMMEKHTNIKVLTKTRPRLLFKVISELYSLGLSTLHLNLTTSRGMSLFTLSVKVEQDCQLTTTVSEIADAVHDVVRRIQKVKDGN